MDSAGNNYTGNSSSNNNGFGGNSSGNGTSSVSPPIQISSGPSATASVSNTSSQSQSLSQSQMLGAVVRPASSFIPASESFRVLTECPLIVMLIFQLYGKFVQRHVPQLIPHMIFFLNYTPPLVAAKLQRDRYKDFFQAQVTP